MASRRSIVGWALDIVAHALLDIQGIGTSAISRSASWLLPRDE
jgi:hypothetical protein